MSAIPPAYQQSSIPPLDGLPFTQRQPDAIRLYPLSNYTFGVKELQPEEDPSVKDRLRRLEEHYEQHGMRRTCEAVLVCHEHNHPHVLMLQIANAFFKLCGAARPPMWKTRSANVHPPGPATTSRTTPRRSRASRCASTSASLHPPTPP